MAQSVIPAGSPRSSPAAQSVALVASRPSRTSATNPIRPIRQAAQRSSGVSRASAMSRALKTRLDANTANQRPCHHRSARMSSRPLATAEARADGASRRATTQAAAAASARST